MESIIAPVASKMKQRARFSHSFGIRVLSRTPINDPGTDPISKGNTSVGSTVPNRRWRKLVNPVRTTACTISVPTSIGGEYVVKRRTNITIMLPEPTDVIPTRNPDNSPIAIAPAYEVGPDGFQSAKHFSSGPSESNKTGTQTRSPPIKVLRISFTSLP